MRDIITVGVGGAGVRIVHASWAQYGADHGVDADGRAVEAQDAAVNNRSAMFAATAAGRHVPRTVLIDADPSSVHAATSDRPSYYSPATCVVGTEDTGGNFCRGYGSVGDERIDEAIAAVRKQAEAASDPVVHVVRSAAGGAGGGLGARLLDRVADDFRVGVLLFSVVPAPTTAASPMEWYNCALSLQRSADRCCGQVLFDNEATRAWCSRGEVAKPAVSFAELNRCVAAVVTETSAAQRLGSAVAAADVSTLSEEMKARGGHREWLGFACRANGDGGTFGASAIDASQALLTMKAPRTDTQPPMPCGSAALHFRGTSVHHCAAVQAAWRTAGTLLPAAVCNASVCDVTAPTELTALCSSSAMQHWVREAGSRFDVLYSKRAYVNWFTAEGSEEGELFEARESMARDEKFFASEHDALFADSV